MQLLLTLETAARLPPRWRTDDSYHWACYGADGPDERLTPAGPRLPTT